MMVRLRRVLSFLLDVYLLLSLSIPVVYITYPFLTLAQVFSLLYITYFLIFDVIVGEYSLGKLVFGIMLVDRKTFNKPSLKARVLRFLFRITPLFIIDIIYFIINKKRLSDVLGDVLCVYIR